MLNKYTFENNTAVIDQPGIINVDKNNVRITTVSGTNSTKIPKNDSITIQVGNIDSMKIGGTSDWGYNNGILEVGYKGGSMTATAILVDNIQITSNCDWCNYFIAYGMLVFQVRTNTSTGRYAYFKCTTTDKYITKGKYEGMEVLPEWWITVMQKANPDVQPEPEPSPEPPVQYKDFSHYIEEFNKILTAPIIKNSKTWNYLLSNFNDADNEWNNNTRGLFSTSTYPEVYNGSDYRGTNNTYELNGVCYTAMQAWLMAMCLSELVATSGTETNMQTKLFQKAYDLLGENGSGRNIPLYGINGNGYTIKGDPMIARLAAGAIYAIHRGMKTFQDMQEMREELWETSMDSSINASNWSGLGCEYIDNRDDFGTYEAHVTKIGYLVNTDLFMPSAPGPFAKDDGSNGRGTRDFRNNRTFPTGQPESLFNSSTYNYLVDEAIDNYIVANYDMNYQTPFNTWNSYDNTKKNWLILGAMIPRCTYRGMFYKKSNLIAESFDKEDTENGVTNIYKGFKFTETNQDTGIYIEGPFSDFHGIWTYGHTSSLNNLNVTENFICDALEIADNSRYPFYLNQFGRKRPCGGYPRISARDTTSVNYYNGLANGYGSPLNGIINASLTAIVADYDAERNKVANQFGHVTEFPKSYPSGHSSQIWTMAMLLGQAKSEKDQSAIIKYMKGAYMYSVARTVDRYHWNSDCIYGRLFGTMILPIINAMRGMQSGYGALKQFVNKEYSGDQWKANLIIKNQTNQQISSTGEIRLYAKNHIGVDTYLPGASVTAGSLYSFNVGENDFSNEDVHCVMHGDPTMDDSYDGEAINEVRFYDYRHYNNIDAGFNATLDTSDPRCDSTLKKSGGTYVIKITNL